jgi:DNA-binding cell septation regulator SpoVG
MNFIITNAKSINRGSLVGAFSIELPSGLIIHDAKLFEKGDSRWLGMPSREYAKNDGSRGFAPIVEFKDRDTSDKFKDAVLPSVVKAFENLEPPSPAKQAPARDYDDTIPF